MEQPNYTPTMIRIKMSRLLLLLTFSVYFFSCTPQKKIPYYLENVKDTSGLGQVGFPEILIQKNDLLSIQVVSDATDPKVDALYNLPTPSGTSTSTLGGFLVDAYGNIQYPKLGTFHAEGLTKQELAEQIRKKLTEPVPLLTNPVVIIRFAGYKVSVLGEVNAQGSYTIPGEKITILEAIALSGGMSDYGRKDNIRVQREVNGKREVGVVDLSSAELYNSPYYNLMQNDVVIVEPSKKKQKQMDQAITFQRLGFVLSLISVAATLFVILR